MNIKQAKEYIKDSVKIYLKKDAYGDYRIPIVRQRPIFLLGAPGIGKTAIMEQVAQELGIALVSYSMTHHTRQSALGLPFIRHKVYGGQEMDISEYTMSEIIASVYDVMEESGIREGILFLDEINCVSETLAPSMLQFLQYKTFGSHQVPEGWVIVTAGNPPEYNKSVREFDVVTMDRLRVLEVEEDFEAWKAYALKKGVHNAVTNFLDLKKEYFYRIETTVNGRSYVTARGWEDLSVVLSLYEEEGLCVDEMLVGQYLRNDRIVKEFTAYYDLYQKYKKDYHVEEILAGGFTDETVRKAGAAPFDERLSLLGMLMDRVQGDIREVMQTSDYLSDLVRLLKALRGQLEKQPAMGSGEMLTVLKAQEEGRKKLMESREKANALSAWDKNKHKAVLRFLQEAQKELQLNSAAEGRTAFGLLKNKFDQQVIGMKEQTLAVHNRLHHLFVFAEKAFADGNEMLILVTELTVNEYSARFIGMFGCTDYQRHNEELMLSERGSSLQKEIADLEL
ncbi:MAG: AAA family ATPase [Lachnospiraceae bacterium]|nr:AAA family ATPase [Lachnospiraceae bacterium]